MAKSRWYLQSLQSGMQLFLVLAHVISTLISSCYTPNISDNSNYPTSRNNGHLRTALWEYHWINWQVWQALLIGGRLVIWWPTIYKNINKKYSVLSLVKEQNADVKSDKLSMIKEKSVLV